MPPILLNSSFDPFQAAIIVIAVIAGFIKWLWENWQLKREAAKRTPPDPEEQRLREAAWRKQTGQAGPPPLPPTAASSPWDELRKAWKELQETARQAQPPVQTPKPAITPPPVQQTRQQPVRTIAPVVATPSAAPAPVIQETYLPPQTLTPKVSVLAALHQLRRDPALMRQAILMQEILGPPKALQTSGDLAI